MDFGSVQVRYQPFIRSVVSSYPERYRDDLFQEGLWGLYLGCCAYDPARNVPFDAYIKVCIRNRVISASRRFSSDAKLVSLEDAKEAVPSQPSPEDLFVETDATRQLLRQLRDRLSDFEQSVLQLYLNGYNSSEAAQILGVPAKSADNAMTRVKKKIREALPD